METYNDNFAIFQYGEFDYIDSVQIYQDGFRRRFPLFYQGDLISFESGTDDISDSELQNLLLIIINGIIQDQELHTHLKVEQHSYFFTSTQKRR